MYTGFMPLSKLKVDVMLETLGLADQYGFPNLVTSISNHLKQSLDIDNASIILNTAKLYDLDELVLDSIQFLDRNASAVVLHESFNDLSEASLIEILQRDSFFAPELDIFKAVCNWSQFHGIGFDNILWNVRLPLIEEIDLLTTVKASGLIEPSKLQEVISGREKTKLLYRGQLIENENVASRRFRTEVISEPLEMFLLDEDYYEKKFCTRHYVRWVDYEGIIIKLGQPSIINHIKLLLWDGDTRYFYSYYIDVSIDQKNWTRVIDYTHYDCRSWQYLFFERQVVHYIKIVGTSGTDGFFHLSGVEAMYKSVVPSMFNDIICPSYNVATLDKHAIVIEGLSTIPNSLIDGNCTRDCWNLAYTCHKIRSGAIVIQLAQPYVISSLRLQLWDLDDDNYSKYYIESSVNYEDWQMLVDNTKEQCKSWQEIIFPETVVVYIRIVGTFNTVNEKFYCGHFECPSMKIIESAKNR
ncbi:BTB/POZ domain-containing protein 9-like [Diorhabda carinulata]|uniref:BTB/POZ domain-containing protein 9-like n=1 Tax=Diorhabda carinulata TaxID=1163345 RepID=UPI0025A2C212|nr:BTB/POZ domain-containing protein 9-like [Diorhabda carinulata]